MLIETAWWVCLTLFGLGVVVLGDTSLSERVRSFVRLDACFGFALGRGGCSCVGSLRLAQTFTRILEWTIGLGVVKEKLARNNKKFMQTLETETYHTIAKEASQRGATVQELLRAVIIPEWLSENRKKWSK